MIIVAIWLQVGLKRDIRAPNFTTFFWGECFHTFLAGNGTFTYTLYTHTQVWVLAWDNMVDAHAQYHS